MNKATKHAKKVATGIAGGCVLLVGLVAIPYPGPGWLIVFAGLAILATEFDWAQRILDRVKDKYDAFQAWLKRQNNWVRAGFLALTGAIVVLTIYLLNGYGLINAWFDLGLDQLNSPLPIFS